MGHLPRPNCPPGDAASRDAVETELSYLVTVMYATNYNAAGHLSGPVKYKNAVIPFQISSKGE